MKMGIIDWVAYVLVIIGGLNWGLVGFFKYDLVAKIFGGDVTAMGARIVYAIVGVAALWMIVKAFMMKPKAAQTMPAA